MNAREAIQMLLAEGFREVSHEGSHKHFKKFHFKVPVPVRGGKDLKDYEEASIRKAIRLARAEEQRRMQDGD